MLTLGQAARATGLGKTTLTRAIKAGRLSATRNDTGGYSIDPAELSRVYSVRPETPDTAPQSVAAVHHATPESDPIVTARLAALEAQVDGLKALLDEVKTSRDQWQEQAARLALKGPEKSLVSDEGLSGRRSWWRRLAG